MKRFLFILLFTSWGMAPLLQAQIDALDGARRAQLLAIPNEIQRVDTLNEWSYNTSGAPSRLYAETALKIAVGIGYKPGEGDAYARLGKVARQAGNRKEANGYIRKAFEIRKSLNDTVGTVSCCIYLGDFYKDAGHFDSSGIYYREGLKLIQAKGPQINTAYLYNSLGRLDRAQGRYEQAMKDFRAALNAYQQLLALQPSDNNRRNILRGQATARLNMAAFSQDNLRQLDSARIALNACLADFESLKDTVNMGVALVNLGNNAYYSSRPEEAIRFYERGLSLQSAIKPDDYYILLKNRARVYIEQGEFAKAFADLQKCLAYFNTAENVQEIAATQFEIGNCFYEQKKFDKAVQCYQLALDSNLNDPLLKSGLLFFLPDALEQVGRKEDAKNYRQKYDAYIESLDASQTRSAWGRLMLNRMGRQAMVTNVERSARKKERVQSMTLLGLAAVMLSALGVGLYLNRQKRRLAERNEQIARQNEQIARQNEEKARLDESIARQHEQIALQEKLELLRNKELETTYARLEGQDEMQKKIGQDLHDSVGAMLSTVKLNLTPIDEVLQQLSPEKRKQYQNANKLLDEAVAELRRISHELSSAVLQKFGLKAQLESLADVIRGSGQLQVELATHGLKGRLDGKTELNIYRMVQELVHNVIKHAQATQLSIQVNHFNDGINVMVEDDGIGFNAAQKLEKLGLGLQNLAARVHDLDGVFQIDSRPGHGTSISIDIPIKSEP